MAETHALVSGLVISQFFNNTASFVFIDMGFDKRQHATHGRPICRPVWHPSGPLSEQEEGRKLQPMIAGVYAKYRRAFD